MGMLAAALGAVAMLTACNDPAAGEDESALAGQSYVALGDSYTAAPGTGLNRGEECYQSAINYPRLIALELDLALTDASCNGAQLGNLTEVQQPSGNPPQLDALGEDTDVVTIRLGANDASLYALSVIRCAQLASRDPAGSPCTDQLGEQYLATAAEQIRTRFDRALAQIADRAPNARIVVVGYPEWAPPTAEQGCEVFRLAEGDYDYTRRANEILVTTLAEAAAAADVDYVDTFAVAEGHHMCADDPWIAGLERTPDAAAVHPFPAEQQAVADLVVDLLRS